MAMFNMGGVKDARVLSNNFLRAGIHNVIFKGIDKAEGFSAIELRFEAVDGSGVHNERIFEPRSEERTQSQYGTNPSEAEQFMCKIKQVIDALDPELARKIETEGDKFAASNFDAFIVLLKKYLDKKVGTQTQIKLIPTSGNFVGFPGYIARLNKDGGIYMTTKVIGNDLVLTAKEKTAIDAAANAKPTDMRQRNDELDDLRQDFAIKDNVAGEDEEMPF
uniref:Uncharacterized protein n=1 Tax=CrAss-like virus sp. ctYsL76 TaxID=2826826 RepID=A0A8S5QML2_9CAUD|nr:MAG TPA: hypothetical protein [CrAss-like virus sp. ctYsL76]